MQSSKRIPKGGNVKGTLAWDRWNFLARGAQRARNENSETNPLTGTPGAPEFASLVATMQAGKTEGKKWRTRWQTPQCTMSPGNWRARR
jgi:hypothetical protein